MTGGVGPAFPGYRRPLFPAYPTPMVVRAGWPPTPTLVKGRGIITAPCPYGPTNTKHSRQDNVTKGAGYDKGRAIICAMPYRYVHGFRYRGGYR